MSIFLVALVSVALDPCLTSIYKFLTPSLLFLFKIISLVFISFLFSHIEPLNPSPLCHEMETASTIGLSIGNDELIADESPRALHHAFLVKDAVRGDGHPDKTTILESTPILTLTRTLLVPS